MTTPITLTGPDHCAQCGAKIDLELVLAEAKATGKVGLARAYVVIRGHQIPVPGLYWDGACSEAIKSGSMEPTLTVQAAQSFLDEIWGPEVTGAALMAKLSGDEEMAKGCAAKLADILEVSLLLGTVIEAGDDLSWLPECNGHHDHGGQDHAKAHLS